VTTLLRDVAMRAVEAADGQIDIIWSASDVGIQTGMFCSPQVWRQRIKPWHREHVEPFKQMGLRTRYHTDGSITPIIDDLIEMGVDLLDPIQPKAAGMDAESLHRQFAGRISFYGGVDTQSLMPYGTAQQVETEVLRLIELLGAEGGYVVAASNAVQPDVPIENILALYRTARDYRYSH
jgi:uroporphyrinogen decarboxylase